MVIEDGKNRFFKVGKEHNTGMNDNTICIMAQAFYGNRTLTYVNRDTFDMLMLGFPDKIFLKNEKIDRTIIPVPGSDTVVFVYNKYQEDKEREYLEKRGYKRAPLTEIPELGIKLYSRVLVCRISPEGEPESLEDGDFPKFIKYLSE